MAITVISRRAIFWGLTIALFVRLSLGVAGATERDTRSDALDGLAGALARSFTAPVRVAVQPILAGRSALPNPLADRLDAMILSALRRRAPGHVTLMARSDLEAVWAEAIEFADRNVQDLLREARADVLVTVEATALQSELEISLRASWLRQGKVGHVLAAPRPVRLTFPDVDFGALRFRQALWREADALIFSARSKIGASGGVPDVVASGGGGEFINHARELVRARVQSVLARSFRSPAKG